MERCFRRQELLTQCETPMHTVAFEDADTSMGLMYTEREALLASLVIRESLMLLTTTTVELERRCDRLLAGRAHDLNHFCPSRLHHYPHLAQRWDLRPLAEMRYPGARAQKMDKLRSSEKQENAAERVVVRVERRSWGQP